MDVPFVSWEPRESVLESIAQSNPGATMYCIYGETYEIPRVKGIDLHWIDVNTLNPTSRSLEFVKSEKFHEPKPILSLLLTIDKLLLQYGIHEAFYIGSTTHVYFESNFLVPDLRKHYRGLAIPYLGKSEVSFSFLYIRAPDIFSQFLEWLMANRHLKQSEEKSSCMYWFKHRTHETDFLPVVSNECDVRESELHLATNLGTEFRGVWDNGSYGSYMGNGRENPTCAFPPGQFIYNWTVCGDGFTRPFIHRHGNSWPLYTMVT